VVARVYVAVCIRIVFLYVLAVYVLIWHLFYEILLNVETTEEHDIETKPGNLLKVCFFFFLFFDDMNPCGLM